MKIQINSTAALSTPLPFWAPCQLPSLLWNASESFRTVQRLPCCLHNRDEDGNYCCCKYNPKNQPENKFPFPTDFQRAEWTIAVAMQMYRTCNYLATGWWTATGGTV